MKQTITQLLAYGRLELAQDIFAEREEELLRILIDVLDMPKHEIFLNKNMEVSHDQYTRFEEIIQERKTGKPLAYILGYSYFYQDKFPVSEQTLIPRYDTEILVELVKKYYLKRYNHNNSCQGDTSPNNSCRRDTSPNNSDQETSCYANSVQGEISPDNFCQEVSNQANASGQVNTCRILDIGTGTGVIALSLHRIFPNAIIKGIDLFSEPFETSKKYLDISSQNVSVEKIDFLDESLWQGLGEWDCIVSNPPYLDDHDMNVLDSHVKDFEPHSALYAEDGGMSFYSAIARFAKKYLVKGGMIFLEIDHKHKKVSQLFSEEEYSYRELVNDLSGLPRVLILKKLA